VAAPPGPGGARIWIPPIFGRIATIDASVIGEQPEGDYTLVMGATTYRLIEHDAAEHFSVGPRRWQSLRQNKRLLEKSLEAITRWAGYHASFIAPRRL